MRTIDSAVEGQLDGAATDLLSDSSLSDLDETDVGCVRPQIKWVTLTFSSVLMVFVSVE